MICWTETAYYILGSQSPFRLQFAKLLEEAKYHYKYFGDNQTDKQSVMTHFKLCSNSQEIQTQNSELGVFSTFCSYYRCSQGSKNHSFPNKLVNNTGVCSISFHFVSSFSKSLEETVLVRHPLNSCDGTLSAELYVFQINNYGCFLSFTTAEDAGCLQGIPGYDTKPLPWARRPVLYLLCHDSLYIKYKLSQSSNYAVGISLVIDLPFTFLSILFTCILALKVTDFLTPVTKLWIICSMACKFSALQISAPLDKFGRIPFPKCQLSQGIPTWTGPRKAE